MITTAHIAGAVTAAILAVSLTACGTNAELEPKAPGGKVEPLDPKMYEESGFGPRKDIYGESGFGPRR